MTDYGEEQEMEAEALQAIFDTHFQITDAQYPNTEWIIELYPEQADNEEELQELNHVAIKVCVKLPAEYPEQSLPEIKIEIVKGLVEDPHGLALQALAEEEAAANEGLPSLYAVCERLREWLAEHNRTGLDDTSAYATMLRKQEQAEQEQKKAAQEFEAQTAQEEFSAAELEELAVRKRRAEGTPCNQENFDTWKERFEAEMKTLKEKEVDENEGDTKKTTKKTTQQVTTMTGYDFFVGTSLTNLDALEAAAEQAQEDEDEPVEDEDVVVDDEALFDDDVDLDDLSFDDEEDEDDEVDI